MYGNVIILGLRKLTELQFKRPDFAAKFSGDKISAHTENIELSAEKGSKTFKVPIHRLEGLIYFDLSPSLSEKTLYHAIRMSPSPLKTLLSVIDGASKALSQVAIVIDRLEVLSLVLGKESTLKFVKQLRV